MSHNKIKSITEKNDSNVLKVCDLFVSQNVTGEVFNCEYVELTEQDINT